MSWFGGSISSLTGQLSNLTKDILTEGTEEISDPATELRLAKEKIEELHSYLTSQKLESERLKRINKDLEEKAESSELQINAISREYRAVLESKEKELNALKRQQAELLEQQVRSAADAVSNDDTNSPHSSSYQAVTPKSSNYQDTTDGFGSFNYDGDVSDWDFDDSIRLQRENNRLRSDLQKSVAEAKHWRSVAGQLGQKTENQDETDTSSATVLELQCKIKELESLLSKKGEQLQQQATSLHEHHRQKVSALKERHATQVKSLQERLSVLEQQLSDGNGGSQHSGTLPESDRPNVSNKLGELERKLASALHDKEKAQNAQTHLEGVLEELQQEVQRLQDLNEKQEHASQNKEEVLSLRTQVLELSQRLEETEEEKKQLRSTLEIVQSDAKNETLSSLMGTKEERDGVIVRLEELISSIGDEDFQKKTAELLNLIDKENLVLKEQKTKLEEQVILLEKTSSNQMKEKHSLLETMATLKSGLPVIQDDITSETDDTIDTKFSSSNEAMQIKEEEVEAEVMRLRSTLEKMKEESTVFESERSDWLMEKETLEDILTDMQKKSKEQEDEIESLKSSEGATQKSNESKQDESEIKILKLENQVSSLQEENQDLERALEELDTQHSEALTQLICQRDKMASQIADQETEIAECRTEIKSLNLTIDQMKEASDNDNLQNLEKYQKYEQEVAEWKQKSKSLDDMENKISELKEKLEKGGLVINDLHMDKQDLEQQLVKAREEIEVKVSKLKESRTQRAEIEKERKEMEWKLREMEERVEETEQELEKWQQMNEERQTQTMENQDHQEVEIECSRLRSKIQEMEHENEAVKQNFQVLIEGSKNENDHPSTLKDSDILVEELRVRQKLEEDENIIQELKEYIEKLRSEREELKKEIFILKSEENEPGTLLESVEQEKSKYVEHIAEMTANLEEKEYELLKLKSELENLIEEKCEIVKQLVEKTANLQAQDSELFDVKIKLENLNEENLKLQKDLSKIQKEKQDIEAEYINQEKQYDAYIEELKAEQESGKESLQSLNEMNFEMEKLKGEVKDAEELKNCLKEKRLEIENLIKDKEEYQKEVKMIKEEVCRLEGLCNEKDREMESVKERMGGFDRDLSEMEESVNITKQQNEMEKKKKEVELMELKTSKEELEVRLSLVQDELESLTAGQQEHSELQSQLGIKNEELVKLQYELEALKSERETAGKTIYQLETDLSLSEEKINSLKEELSHAIETIDLHNLNVVNINKNSQTEDDSCQENTATLESDLDRNGGIEFMERAVSKPLLSSHSQRYSQDTDDIDDDEDQDRFLELEKEMEDLRGKLTEKDGIVANLQRSNSSLLELLEKKADGDGSLGNRLNSHKLESELKNLRAEREQMVAVVSEKSRENSSLKSEIHRLMDLVSAGQAALSKVQQDNFNLDQRQHSPPKNNEEEHMKREALNNMARLVRDKDTEIEALTLKNNTLLAVLQESNESQAAAHLGPLLKEKETLSQQINVMVSEREQLITCVNQKHSESLAFHAEVQRLTALLAETKESADKVKAEYAALIPSFEGKTQALLSSQQELVECKQKLTELEIRHGELIQRSNSQQQSPDSPTTDDLKAEFEKYKRLECDYKSMVLERDGQIQSLSQKAKTFEETASSKETECVHLRKQLENSKFQLTGLIAEIADAKSEKELMQHKSDSQGEELITMRNSLNQMTLALKDKDVEILSLKDQISTLNCVLQNQKGDEDQVSQLIRDHESAVAVSRQLQQERDKNAMLAEQRFQENEALKAELLSQKDKVFKLGRELERLRSHLLEIEEGYTKEALDAEEREKELRNKLAVAEEQLLTSSSHVQLASQESHRQIESLQEQLHHIASQRDAAYMQIATTQDQCQQYAASLSNLQLVLEHFQKEKDSAIALETEKYHDQANALGSKVKDLEKELEATRTDLTEALDGLEAASRLSEQLDRKENALAALKEEVQLREQALKMAEDEITRLNSSTEAKVDKMLMHNMVLTWLTSPEKKRHEIVQLIGHVLDFSPHDFSKIESAHNQDSLWIGFFKRSEKPSQPSKVDQSFSQLFVKFLEKESSPAPTPVKLPVEAMAAEAQLRHKTTFNPFTAPRHVTHGNEASGSSSSSHLLIPQDNPHPSPLFAPVTNVSSTGESAILKDVLDWKR